MRNSLLNFLKCDRHFQPLHFNSKLNIRLYIKTVNVLIVGAGGLGCETVKNLIGLGFNSLTIVDMDTIELTNLNRQFLFRESDIGNSKAITVQNYVKKIYPNVNIIGHHNSIENLNTVIFEKCKLVMGCLDNLATRRWINAKLMSLVRFDNEKPILSSIIPYIDGGTEGLMGSVRVIFPSLTACLECTIDLFSSKVTYPVCTICNFPKSFGHCVLYAKIVLWEKVIPFEEDFSTTNEKHLKWILNEAIQHAKKWNIEYNVDTNKIQEILSNIIPAVITTNCSISAICCMEAFKIVTSAFHTLDNLLNLNFYNGVYMNCVRLDKTIAKKTSRSKLGISTF